eukprot:COSAG01_NODE_13216_length_1619_cov_1.269737_1_plen_54_part_10
MDAGRAHEMCSTEVMMSSHSLNPSARDILLYNKKQQHMERPMYTPFHVVHEIVN